MSNPLDQYWTIQDNRLYGGDVFFKNHMIDIQDFMEVAILISVLATFSIFVIGVLVVL